ncbi:MAG: YfiR family protein [Candidatus Riflebacteria bacterium]|nr:YfiR family protein [Candidatus Riflebacteria bacterium]
MNNNRISLYGFLLFLMIIPSWQASGKPLAEYEVKVAFLLKFASFVEWSNNEKTIGSNPVLIGVVGKDPFGSLLPSNIPPEEPDFLEFSVTRVSSTVNPEGEISKFHILYFSETDPSTLSPMLEKLNGKAVLTVGEGETFLTSGGIVSFSLENNRVRFQVNLKNAKKANLKISSQLLNLARFVIR